MLYSDIGGRKVTLLGDTSADDLFIQMTGEWEEKLLKAELDEVERLSPGWKRCIAAVAVKDWNRELSPWAAEAVFGDENFGSGAAETLAFIENELIPELEKRFPAGNRKFFICGYSLAGLFALWSAYSSDCFSGAAGVSPSVWFPGWLDFAASHEMIADAVYLSLGRKEEKVRNPRLAEVGNAIRAQHELLRAASVPCALEWNEGNHFAEPEKRLARGIACLERLRTGE